jgi:hypothetical protein
MISIVKVFTNTLVTHRLPVTTLLVCADCLSLILESNCPFLDTSFFVKLLKSDIHVALLALALDTNEHLTVATARLIVTIWRKFAPNYVEGLNEVLDRGIATALTSPDSSAICRTFRIFNELVQEPQSLVDAFVNYDCDQSGFFRNIFQNSVVAIAKFAYPGQESLTVQRAALGTLVAILENLWMYFMECERKKKKKEIVEDDSERFYLNAKKAKDIFDQGIQLFKRSPKKGIHFFVEHKIAENDAMSLAKFLFNTPQLDPSSIGEVLGTLENLEILRNFVSLFDFRNLSFESAFRQFLSKFQVPGEAQMIDRVMEQFGSKFYTDNPGLFSCADTVYVLAFSTLILHTDAHHPNVKQRMTLEEFVANNKGIDDGKDLPYGFLKTLFKGITSDKINLSSTSLPHPSLLTRQQKADLYKQQCSHTLLNARERIRSSTHQFHRAESSNLVGPMYHSIWGCCLAAFTNSLFQSTDDKITELCLRGFQFSTHIASHCYVEDALETIIDSFPKFTRLQSDSLNTVNLLCTGALIETAIHDQQWLKGGWAIIFSQLATLYQIERTPQIAGYLNTAEVLFTQSSSLDRESIIDFCRAMCSISSLELKRADTEPYLLIKFVDVADWNMSRPMYVWNEIWTIIGGYLSEEVYNAPNLALSIIDVMRQLAVHFLQKKEMMEYHFQQRFLEPFSDIFDKHPNPLIQEIILDDVDQLVFSFAESLHSGWAIFCKILSSAARREEKLLKTKGFGILEKLIEQNCESLRPHQIHMMTVITHFVKYDKDCVIGLQGVAKFLLVAGRIQSDDEWESLFLNIGLCLQHHDAVVQHCAEETIISIVTFHGCMSTSFSPKVWHFFFQNTLFELINEPTDDLVHVLDVFTNVYKHIICNFAAQICEYRLDILRFLFFCVDKENPGLKDCALKCVVQFVADNKDHIDPELMTVLASSLDSLNKQMVTSLLFVDSLTRLIDIFKDDVAKVAEFMAILRHLTKECQNAGKPVVYECWCHARLAFFDELVRQNELRQAAECLRESIVLFGSYCTDQVWCQFAVACLDQLTKVGQDVFEKCCESSLRLICDLIETESAIVRKQLILVLKRRLGR